LEVRIIMACTIYHMHDSVQPARGALIRRNSPRNRGIEIN